MKISLRPLIQNDFESLSSWLSAPHVVRWWGPAPVGEALEEKYLPRLAADAATRVYVIEADNKPLGIIQCYRHCDYPDYDQEVGIAKAAGTDYLIGESGFTGRGIGSEAISQMSRLAFALYPETDVIVSVPQKENRASCRALEKAGYKLIDERQMKSDNLQEGVSCIYQLSR
ncbi:MAG: acetyltransferase [Candidatus Obscuribacterales bacterium]|nr:acetyltransferase [Candidatus Obscuribacterales bacterium]